MERWRWMPEDLGPSYVLVNIAAFRLDVIEGEGDHSVLTMKTVVGKEYTRTPFFAARIEEVIANPWWNVPDSIAVKELWPKQRRDLLRDQPQWTSAAIDSAIDAGNERAIRLTTPGARLHSLLDRLGGRRRAHGAPSRSLRARRVHCRGVAMTSLQHVTLHRHRAPRYPHRGR